MSKSDTPERAGLESYQLIDKCFEICTRMLPFLRSELKDEDDCKRIVSILYVLTGFNAVELKCQNGIEAFAGEEEVAVKYDTGKDEAENCIEVPVKKGNTLLACLKFYRKKGDVITDEDEAIARGVGSVISAQLEQNSKDYNARLRAKAELKALQAQINPHFLFNALNTIAAMCRTEPLEARRLLIHLSRHFRAIIQTSPDLIEIHKELENVKSYLEIEKARHGDRIRVEWDIQPNVSFLIPPFTIQPIVENAIKHGLAGKKDGVIVISVKSADSCYQICIKDNGCGMEPEVVKNLITNTDDDKRIGISNVNRRLKEIYGEDHGMVIHSEPGKGTEVIIIVPIRERRQADVIKGRYSR
ncbi:LytS/YehU family sensor histidine kinase [Caldicoprobacter guelmensis]|uniref:sensor histidine kinase n=1 Tax=Caldicoprobacter guelmensis TaxID=1170224 RepID=UPI001957A26C|nr:histidine kinase [Caldicoprobacter guelmensis]MBM7582803.1 LytS/YehU family sensor histidine kinase [Caldicoprobacter guelmensis]